MDALSTHPVSSLQPRAFLSTPNSSNPNLLKPPTNRPFPHYPNLSTKPNPSSLSLPSSSLSPKPLSLPFLSSSTPGPPQPTTRTHRKASTGYAAALLDAACCHGALAAVARDVRKFARAVGPILADPLVEEGRKGEVVKGVAEGGGFDRYLVSLVRMLVGKGKVGVVGEVMGEFWRIWEEMNGTQRVFVVSSKERRIGEGEVAGIAKEVQRKRGAVKVKFRHLVCESSPRFAV